jgi:prepilin-type N-terminal cleavage/methylation domain-containing protein
MQFKKGFSLLELILAVAIFSLAGVGLAMLLIDSNTSTQLVNERTDSLLYAQEGINGVIGIRSNSGWNALAAGTYGLTDVDGVLALDDAGSDYPDEAEKYTRVITIADAATSIKNVQVNISWEITPARMGSTTLETILTNWAQE